MYLEVIILNNDYSGVCCIAIVIAADTRCSHIFESKVITSASRRAFSSSLSRPLWSAAAFHFSLLDCDSVRIGDEGTFDLTIVVLDDDVLGCVVLCCNVVVAG